MKLEKEKNIKTPSRKIFFLFFIIHESIDRYLGLGKFRTIDLLCVSVNAESWNSQIFGSFILVLCVFILKMKKCSTPDNTILYITYKKYLY